MKIKHRILYIGIALWLVAFIQMISSGFSSKQSKEEAIVTAFADNDFLKTVSTITASGSYKSTYLSEEDREDILLDIAHNLGISNSLVYDSITVDDTTTSSLVRTLDHTTTVLKLITVEKQLSNQEIQQKHIVQAEIEFGNSLESAFYYKDLLKEAFEKTDIYPDISIHLKGEMAGSLSMTQKNIMIDKIIEGVDGKIVTQHRSDDLFTVYAYTEKIDNYILTGSMKTNINIAISYDEENDITEVYMATPFLNTDF